MRLEEGAAVLAHAERMEEKALAFERRLAGSGSGLEGILHLSSSDWFGSHMLAPVVAEFTQRHPLGVVELLTAGRLYSLRRREADLAFRIRRFEEPEVIACSLMRISYAAYLHQNTEALRAGDGAGASLITMDSAFGEMPDAVWLRRILPGARVAARSNNRDVQGRLCAAGIGVAVLPQPLSDSLQGVRRIDPGEPPPSRMTWVGHHRDLRRLAHLRAMLDLAVERLRS